MPAKRRAPATQSQIASELGVSQSAVSFVLSGRGASIAADTRRAILGKARELGYRARVKSPPKNAPLVAYLSQDTAHLWPVYALRLARGIQQEAQRAGFIVAQHVVGEDAVPQRVLDSAKLCICNQTLGNEALERIADSMPLVLLHYFDAAGKHDSVMPDNCSGIRKAMTHLAGLGHSRFAFFGIRRWNMHAAERFGAFHQVVSELDLPTPRPEWIVTPYRREKSVQDVERLAGEAMASMKRMRQKPTALICADDQSALAFHRLARDAGLRIPKDLSVVGFDDLDECMTSQPTLSSISQPLEAMGAEAFRLAMERLEDKTLRPRRLRVDVEFMPRGSVGSAPGRGK